MKKFNKLSLLWLLVLVLPVYLFATRFKVSEVNKYGADIAEKHNEKFTKITNSGFFKRIRLLFR